MNQHAQDSLAGVRTIKALGLTARSAQQFRQLADEAGERVEQLHKFVALAHAQPGEACGDVRGARRVARVNSSPPRSSASRTVWMSSCSCRSMLVACMAASPINGLSHSIDGGAPEQLRSFLAADQTPAQYQIERAGAANQLYQALRAALPKHREFAPLLLLGSQNSTAAPNVSHMRFDASRLRAALSGTGPDPVAEAVRQERARWKAAQAHAGIVACGHGTPWADVACAKEPTGCSGNPLRRLMQEEG